MKPLAKPVYFLIKEIKFAKHTDLHNGHHDKVVFDCIEHCRIFNNRASMHLLAYALFSGTRKPIFTNDYYYLLILLLHDPEASIKDIATVLTDAFVTWKGSEKSFVELEQTERNPDQYWGKNFDTPVLPDEDVQISHGGGFYHLVDFFRGRTPGYKLECGGLGIQVSPLSKERSLSYAAGNSIFHCDLPATLDAKISAKHLDHANNGYEAGLRTDKRQYIRDIDIKIHLPIWVGNISVQKIKECYPKNPMLQHKLIYALKNVQKVFAKAVEEARSYHGLKS